MKNCLLCSINRHTSMKTLNNEYRLKMTHFFTEFSLEVGQGKKTRWNQRMISSNDEWMDEIFYFIEHNK